jgi:hypothetical protein
MLRRALCLAAFLAASPSLALDWRVDLGPDDALYPVLDLSLSPRKAHADDRAFGEGSGLLQVSLRAARDAQPVTLRLSAPHLAENATVQAVLPRAGERYVLRPRLVWDRERLAALRETTSEPLQLTLSDDATQESRRVDARLHPLDEALYFARDGAERVDLSWIFAAYADPRDAAVEALIDSARSAHASLRFDGYAADAADAVLAQTFALWEALQAHGVRYAEEDPGVARGPLLWSQRVRRHGEVWRERRANCLDGSLLIAAALERLGIDSTLLLVPRHALLAVHTRADGSAPVFVETTALGAVRRPSDDDPPFVDRLDERINGAALGSFQAALAAGNERYRRDARRFGKHDPNYQWIDLATARAYGILPLSTTDAGSAPSGSQ